MADHEEKSEGKHGESHGGGSHGGGGGHGGGSHEEHEGAPEWLISFADNVTLMMGFFVIMLAMNIGPKGAGAKSQGPPGENASSSSPDMIDLTLAIRAAFNNPVSVTSNDPDEQPLVRRLLARAAAASNDDSLAGKDRDVQSVRPSNMHFPGGMVWFDDGSSKLPPAALSQLADFAKQIHGLRLIIELRGNVSAAEAFGQNDAGMHLSFERALTVEQNLVQAGIDRRQIRIVACGDNERVKDQAYSPEDQRQNQRVEVVVTEDLMTDRIMKPDDPATKPQDSATKPEEGTTNSQDSEADGGATKP